MFINNNLKDKLACLSKETLAAILEQEAIINSAFTETVNRLINFQDPEIILSSILNEIDAIYQCDDFIDWKNANAFSLSLDRLLYNIEILLLPKHPTQALAALEAFLKNPDQIQERVDEFGTYLEPVFEHAESLAEKARGILALQK